MTGKSHSIPSTPGSTNSDTQHDASVASKDALAVLDEALEEVARENPRIEHDPADPSKATSDLRAVLEASLAVNSSLVLEDVLQIVMQKAVEMLQAERGIIMLLDDSGTLQIKSVYNLEADNLSDEDHRISQSVASQVATTGKAIYTSDALADDRYAKAQSVVDLHLRSIICVPIKIKEDVIGIIYLDNSSQARTFLKSDLYIFELYSQLVANALHNASVYDSLLDLKKYNESVISLTPVGLIVMNTQGSLVTINPTALEILDQNRSSIKTTGESDEPTAFLDMLPDTERPRWKHMIREAQTAEEGFQNSRHYHNTGYIEKVLSIRISPIAGLLNGTDGLIMTLEDITEKVIMEKYVIVSEKLVAKGEMAASVAHELNNYLAITSTNAELLSTNLDKKSFDKAKFNSRSIVENVFKIKRFVDSLMDFSKPESEYISYDIRNVVDDLLFSLRIQTRFKQIHFTVDLSETLPNLEMDVGLIQQVLMNLFNNAADAIEEMAIKKEHENESFRGKIAIAASYDREHESILVSISDNAIGMSEETLSKIFTLHFTTKKSGHGLGLANCKKIVDQHHGKLHVKSELGKGTEFELVLPRFQPKADQKD